MEGTRLQYSDYVGTPDAARAQLLETLRRLEHGGASEWHDGENPYPGLDSYDSRYHGLFFGRVSETKQLEARLRSSSRRGGAGLLAIVGPSGCGKSSLLRAGLLPRLTGESSWLAAPPWTPAPDPFAALGRSLAMLAGELGLDPATWSAHALRGRLTSSTAGLREVAADLLAAAGGPWDRRLLISVDQAEELLTQVRADARNALLYSIAEAASGPVRVVATLRAEFLDDLAADDALSGMQIEAYPLGPVTRELLHLVITMPARRAGIWVEPELVARMVDATGDGQALPLLAFTLHELADGVDRGGTLSPDRYDELGGVAGALIRHADAALKQAGRVSGLPESRILMGLTRLVTVDDADRRAGRSLPLADVPAPLAQAFAVLADQRLLVRSADGAGGAVIQLAHEALMTAWPPLDSVLAERIGSLRAARSVNQAAKEWTESGHDRAVLWDGPRLARASAALGISMNARGTLTMALKEEDPDLEPASRDFLGSSARHARRNKARAIATVASILTFALIAFGVAVWRQQAAVGNERAAVSAQKIAAAGALNALAGDLQRTNAARAIQADVAAVGLQPNQETKRHLAGSLIAAATATFSNTTESESDATFSQDGNVLLTSGVGAWRLWDFSNPDAPELTGNPVITGEPREWTNTSISPNGLLVAAGGYRYPKLGLWDVSAQDHPLKRAELPLGDGQGLWSVRFTSDSHILVGVSANSDYSGSILRLWDVRVPARPKQLASVKFDYTCSQIAISPDNKKIAVAGDSLTTVDIHDPAHPVISDTKSVDTTLGDTGTADPTPTGSTYTWFAAVGFSADGKRLATGMSDGSLALWDTSRLAPLHLGTFPAPRVKTRVNTVAFDPSGKVLAVANYPDSGINLWSTADPAHAWRIGTLIFNTPDSTSSPAQGATFSPEGAYLVADSDTFATWDATNFVRIAADPLGVACSQHGYGDAAALWRQYAPKVPYRNPCQGR